MKKRPHPVGATRVSRFKSPIDKAKGYEVIWQNVAPLFNAARILGNAEYVYFIGEPDDGALKIGHSKDPIGRLRSMQTGNPRRLRIEHVLVGAPALEKLLHEIWRDHAIVSTRQVGKVDAPPGTEWFDPAVRAELEPILRTAAQKQADLLKGMTSDAGVGFDDLERLVREAHAAHGFVMKRLDVPLLLGQHIGYARPRIPRI
jgi:hypothetical protein